MTGTLTKGGNKIMCDCINAINAKLVEADINTMLDIPIAWSVDEGLSTKGVLIATAKRDKTKRQKPSRLYASYCPFCGQSYENGGPK